MGQSRTDRHGRSASPPAHSGHGMDGSTADVGYYLALVSQGGKGFAIEQYSGAAGVLPGFQPPIGSRCYFCSEAAILFSIAIAEPSMPQLKVLLNKMSSSCPFLSVEVAHQNDGFDSSLALVQRFLLAYE